MSQVAVQSQGPGSGIYGYTVCQIIKICYLLKDLQAPDREQDEPEGLTNERWADSTLNALDADGLLSQQLLRVAFFKSGHASGLSDNRKEACALAVKQSPQ